MPLDDEEGVPALLVRTAEAAIAAQEALDATASEQEIESRTRMWLRSIPYVDVRLEFGLSTRTRKGFFVPTRARSALRHRLSFALTAVPSPIEPPPEQWGPSAVTMFEPPFMVDPETEAGLALSVCEALKTADVELVLVRPELVSRDAMAEAGEDLATVVTRPSRPELGAVAFRVSDAPSTFLLVIVTEKAKKDGIFMVRPGTSPSVYSIPGDGNSMVVYEPLHRLTMALADWLSGVLPRRRAPAQRLPQEWGFTRIAVFAEKIATGYQQCIETLSRPQTPRPIGQFFDVSQVFASVAFGIRQGDAPLITVAEQADASTDLIEGRIGLEFERLPTAIGVTMTLIAPGFVLSAGTCDMFIERAQKAAQDIARQFPDRGVVDYVGAIMRPRDPRRVVVTLWTDEPGDPFRYLATWPVYIEGVERHFVFRCRGDGEALDDIKVVMSATDSTSSVTLTHAEASNGSISEDAYEQFNRFFRASRVWRAGITRTVEGP